MLVGRQGQTLFGLAQHDGQYARVAKALTRVHQDNAQVLSVDALASEAHMSVSAFHRAFRQVTMESPVQYVKKVRLVKARDLINHEGKKVSEAALLVGYIAVPLNLVANLNGILTNHLGRFSLNKTF